jgi:hypothetical protein
MRFSIKLVFFHEVLRVHVLLLMLISFLRTIGIVVVCQLSVFPRVLHDVWALKELVVGYLDATLLDWLELWNNEGVITHLISESLFGLVCCPNLFKQTLRLFFRGRHGGHVLTR